MITTISLLVVVLSGSQAFGYGAPPPQNNASNYTVEINSDKESYNLGESITFSGSVNKYDERRNLRISIFDSSNNFIVTQKTPVNVDGTFLHSVILNEKFFDGKFKVKAQYGISKTTVKIISFVIQSNDDTLVSQDNEIPNLIKNNAGWWAAGEIDDNSFVQGIQFLIKVGLMKISN